MHYREYIDKNKENIIRDVQRLVRIKSVDDTPAETMPFGKGIGKALKEALQISSELGFDTCNLDGYAAYAEAGEGEEVVGILVHLDVVPEGEGWQMEPYGAKVKDGKIYGRGTSDDKGPAVAALYALKSVVQSGIKLKRRVRVIFGTNEEIGSKCMEYYIKQCGHVDVGFTPDANFPLIHGEKPILQGEITFADCGEKRVPYLAEIAGGKAANMVADDCRAVLQMQEGQNFEEKFNAYCKKHVLKGIYQKEETKHILSLSGASSHGSRPEEGVNAISHMVNFLTTLPLHYGSEFVKKYMETIGLTTDGSKLGIAATDAFGSLTFCVGTVRTKKDGFAVGIDVRYPLTLKDQARELFDAALKEKGIVYEEKAYKAGLYMPVDSKLVKTLMKCYSEETGDRKAKPFTIGGGTYARSMKNILGFGMVFPGEEEVMHKHDEYVKIDRLITASKIYAAAIVALATNEG